jgi:hypothetical protein
MLDQDALKRDAQSCISDWPVSIRHYYSAAEYDEVTAGLNTGDDVSELMEGGLLDKPDMDIIAIFDDFTHGAPQNRDRVDVLIGGNWLQFEVKRTPDIYDPLGPTYQFKIGSPNT